jgi:hypothetical protein
MTEMTETEVKTIRWVEHILAPLVVMSVIGLASFAMSADTTMAELSKDHERYDETTEELKSDVKDIRDGQHEQLESQHTIEITVKEIETHQQHFKDEISNIKVQNTEILKILRESR